MRLIDADALMEKLEAWAEEADRRNANINYAFATAIIAQVKTEPTIEPERKRGNWVGIDDEPCDDWECDRCGEIVTDCFYDGLPNFCPNCGADMRGGET